MLWLALQHATSRVLSASLSGHLSDLEVADPSLLPALKTDSSGAGRVPAISVDQPGLSVRSRRSKSSFTAGVGADFNATARWRFAA